MPETASLPPEERLCISASVVPGAGLEPARTYQGSADFKSAASTDFATRARHFSLRSTARNSRFLVSAITDDRIGSQLGGEGRNRTGVHGFAGRCMTTLPPRLCMMACGKRSNAAQKKQNPGLQRRGFMLS